MAFADDRHVYATRTAAEPCGCIRWTGRIAVTGYGTLGRRYAHRIAWELHRGPIPAGMTIDHLCRTRWCVNVEHLEVVTLAENIRRVPCREPETCKRGHDLTNPENTYRKKDGYRSCRPCAIDRARRHRNGIC